MVKDGIILDWVDCTSSEGEMERGGEGEPSSDNCTEGDCVNAPVPTARKGVRDGGLHGRPGRKGGSETPGEREIGERIERGAWGEACAQGGSQRVGRMKASRSPGSRGRVWSGPQGSSDPARSEDPCPHDLVAFEPI